MVSTEQCVPTLTKDGTIAMPWCSVGSLGSPLMVSMIPLCSDIHTCMSRDILWNKCKNHSIE